MSGETIEVLGTSKVLMLSGGAIPNGTVALASTASFDRMGADGNGYPDARFVLTATFNTAPVEGSIMSLYAQELGIDSGIDAQTPESTRPGRFIGSFVVDNVTGIQSMMLTAYDLPPKANYFIHNNGTGQATAFWKLTVIPRTYKAAA